MDNKMLIAVTGGIGSGKSLAMQALKDAGFYTLCADGITAELYQTLKVKKMLKKMFPTAVKGWLNLKIDRAEISKIVFNDKAQLALLTNAITPLVMAEIEKRHKSHTGVTIAEIPLLFECNFTHKFSKIIVITRPLEDRINSVITRSNLTREQVIKRINNQVDYSSIDLSRYTVIENNCDLITFKERVLSAVKDI